MPRPRQVDPAALTLRLQIEGPLSAQALAAALGVDRSNVSRALATLGDQILRLGVTRGTRYALRREVRSAGNRFPLYRVDAAGRAHEWAELTALQPRVWRLSWADASQFSAWARLIMLGCAKVFHLFSVTFVRKDIQAAHWLAGFLRHSGCRLIRETGATTTPWFICKQRGTTCLETWWRARH